MAYLHKAALCAVYDCSPEEIDRAISKNLLPQPYFRTDKVLLWHGGDIQLHVNASCRLEELPHRIVDTSRYLDYDDLLGAGYDHDALAHALCLDEAGIAAQAEEWRKIREERLYYEENGRWPDDEWYNPDKT